MKITVERFVSDDRATLGLVAIDGAFQCFSLEDRHRAVKVPGETRIPAGTYRVALRRDGALHTRYAAQFPGFHKGMLWLRGVPGFEWIYIHLGNTPAHTEGCILVGQGSDATPGNMLIRASTPAYRAFYERVAPAAEAGTLEIEIVDRDRPPAV